QFRQGGLLAASADDATSSINFRGGKTALARFKQFFFKKVFFLYLKMTAKNRLKPRKRLRFETDIVGHCNLNCNCCAHFSPLVKEYFVKPETFEKDFARLSQLAGRDNENIDIMGGEPLLHPQLLKILEIARKYFDGPVNIVTNGLLLEKMDGSFWDACRKNKIRVKVTSYPIKLDRQKIKRLAREHSVKLYMRKQFMDNHVWCRNPKDMEGRQNIDDNMRLCLLANFCVFLRDGKLSTCCQPSLISSFNAYFGKNIAVSESDFIDIHKAQSIEEIYAFLCKPISFCRYCKMREIEVGIEWKQSQREISEWFD
ncbi:MAG: radical SAM protein, partial [Spirochaetes bacterium]|nr:radical SAM protein [Spirochaetota bacterium]